MNIFENTNMIKLFVKMALSKNKQGTRWDFMSQLLNDTLSAWLLIESLSPEVNFTAEDIPQLNILKWCKASTTSKF